MSISVIEAITIDEMLKGQEAQIASLTEENERLRELAQTVSDCGQILFESQVDREGPNQITLEGVVYTGAVVDRYFSLRRSFIEMGRQARAALQPKEGEG